MDEMKHVGVLRLSFLIALATIAGCKATGENNSPAEIADRPFTILATGQNSLTGMTDASKKLVVIHSQAELDSAFSELTNDTPPSIDFNNEVVLLALSDSLPSGGYGFTIKGVQDYAQYTQVNVELSAPGQGCVVTQAITTPFQFGKMTKPNVPVLFNESFFFHDCT